MVCPLGDLPNPEKEPVSFTSPALVGRFFTTSATWETPLNTGCCCQVASVMSDSVQPHRRQPTRLPRPWDSPGKNTGLGSHFLLQYMKVKSESEVAQSCPTLRDPMDCSLPVSSVHGIFQARVGCHCLLHWTTREFPISLFLDVRISTMSITYSSEMITGLWGG